MKTYTSKKCLTVKRNRFHVSQNIIVVVIIIIISSSSSSSSSSSIFSLPSGSKLPLLAFSKNETALMNNYRSMSILNIFSKMF